MDNTMQVIHKLANERHVLYRQAGRNKLNSTEQQRLQEINNQLPILWDRYRREYAARRQPLAPTFTRSRAA